MTTFLQMLTLFYKYIHFPSKNTQLAPLDAIFYPLKNSTYLPSQKYVEQNLYTIHLFVSMFYLPQNKTFVLLYNKHIYMSTKKTQ